MASTISPDMPILKVSQSSGCACSCLTASKSCFASVKAWVLFGAGITIKPRSFKCGNWLIFFTNSATSLGWHPSLLSWASILTCKQIFNGTWLASRCLDKRSAIIKRSTPCTHAKLAAKCLVLLRWTCPIKCHSMAKSFRFSILSKASCK